MDLSALARWPAYVFLIGTMAGLGLQVAPAQLVNTLRNGRLIARALVANCVVAPLLGVLAATTLPLSEDVRSAILLVSLAPGGVAAVQFTSKARESLSYAAALELVLAAAALLVAPLWLMALFGPALPLPVPPIGEILSRLVPLLFLPLAIAVGIRSQWPRVAKRLELPVVSIGSLAFIANVAFTGSAKSAAVSAMTLVDGGAMLGLVACLMALGWALGGPARADRRVLASATSFRNIAMCLVVAVHWFPDRSIDAAVLAFSLLMIPPNVALMLYESFRAKKAAGTPSRA